MEYISSDTNVWLDFATINRLEIPFKLPYTYIMNEDAITDELLSPKELRDNLVGLGLQAVELSEGVARKQWSKGKITGKRIAKACG